MRFSRVAWAARELASGRLLYEFVRTAAVCHALDPGTCLVCGYSGQFRGHDVLFGVQCPKCLSLSRQRLLALAVRDGVVSFKGRRVLHFAPEPAAGKVIDRDGGKRTTSTYPGNGADLRLNIEAIDLPDASFDTIFCSHVLEHVDDAKALPELKRILKPGGQLLIEVPIIEGWERTYENPSITSERDRTNHFGQFDHVRYYGRDLRDRIRSAGFELAEYVASPEDTVTYRLERGETLFIAQ